MKKQEKTPALRKRGRIGGRRDTLTAYLFLAPAILTFLMFVLVPAISIFVLSFYKYNVISPMKFIGWTNWIRAFVMDPRLITVLKNTAKFVLLLAPMHMFFGLLLAQCAYRVKRRWRMKTYRLVLYFPIMVSTASVAIAWTFIFDKDFGILNYFLGFFGVDPIYWMKSSFWVYPGTMIFSLWKNVGVYFLYFLIALQNVDPVLLEAADIDGASEWQKYFKVTLPMITPTIFFVLITMLIGQIQIFDEPYLLSQGGPGDSSRTISLYIYELAYQTQQYGYASTVAILLLVAVLIITFVQFRLQKVWVNYDSE